MNPPDRLRVKLLSDTTISSGRGAAGDVDIDIQLERGCLPVLGGKMLHGLLRAAWLQMGPLFPELQPAAVRVFGLRANFGTPALLCVGDARLQADARSYILAKLASQLDASSVQIAIRDVLTSVRCQTSEDERTGAPKDVTLRRSRLAVRGLELTAPLGWLGAPGQEELRCFALAVLATRHIGLSRRRGRGLVEATLNGDRELTLAAAGLGGRQ